MAHVSLVRFGQGICANISHLRLSQDHERRKVPAISPEEPTITSGPADADLLADIRQPGANPDRLKEAAVLLASVAKILTSDPARGAIGQAARADLVCKLEALESRLRVYVDASPLKATPAGCEANFPSGSLGEKEPGTRSRFSTLLWAI